MTTFEVEEMWKGSPDRTIRVRTCGADRPDLGVDFFCEDSFSFQVGARYLIFAGGAPLKMDRCAPTAWVERAGPTLRWLADKPRTPIRK